MIGNRCKSYPIPRSQSLTGNAVTEALPLLLWKAEPSEVIPIQSMGTRKEQERRNTLFHRENCRFKAVKTGQGADVCKFSGLFQVKGAF